MRARKPTACRSAPPIPQPTMPRSQRLALWATRYTPAVSPWGEENGADGFFLDVTGAAHLFGGEETLLADLVAPARPFRPAGAARHRRYGRRRLGAVALSSAARRRSCRPGRKPKRLRRCRSRRCGSRPIRARRCGGSASSASARSSTSRARRLRRASRPSCCSASTRRSAARPSRSPSIVAAAGLSQPALSAWSRS